MFTSGDMSNMATEYIACRLSSPPARLCPHNCWLSAEERWKEREAMAKNRGGAALSANKGRNREGLAGGSADGQAPAHTRPGDGHVEGLRPRLHTAAGSRREAARLGPTAAAAYPQHSQSKHEGERADRKVEEPGRIRAWFPCFVAEAHGSRTHPGRRLPPHRRF